MTSHKTSPVNTETPIYTSLCFVDELFFFYDVTFFDKPPTLPDDNGRRSF